MTSPEALWERVFALAERGRFSSSPNPRVGAVLVDDDGRLVGEGFHERAGEPHAEVAALRAAGDEARGATLLVNLEPCASYGRTPPCTDALIAAGVKRVVCSIEDPDLRTAGRGVNRLRDNGIEVDVGACAEVAGRLNEAYLVSMRKRRPFVHLKWAASLDGRIASTRGASKWITGEEARNDALRLREEHDAVLVGAGTVLADNPLLTRRLDLNRSVVPHRRIVLDGALRVPPDARVFNHRDGEVWLVTALPPDDDRLGAFRGRGVRVESLPGPEGAVDLAALLKALHSAEARSLLVEGGGRTAWTFLAAGFADRVTAYLAPLLLGGADAPGPLAGPGFLDPQSAFRTEELETRTIGPDLRVTARLAYPA